jgi:hypothetical protein
MEFLDWLAAWPGAVWLQGSGTAYLFVNATHILGIGLLIGAILPLDLRLIGLVSSPPLEIVAPFLLRAASIGLALALVSGLWLFSVKPREYVMNPAFLTKIALLGIAMGNVGLQHLGTSFQRAVDGQSVHMRARIQAALSALLWLSVLVSGRWIGFI